MKPIYFQIFPLGHANHHRFQPFYTEFRLGLEPQSPQSLAVFFMAFGMSPPVHPCSTHFSQYGHLDIIVVMRSTEQAILSSLITFMKSLY